MLQWIIILSLHIHIIQCMVNIATHGEISYCNSNPFTTVSIAPLSTNDLQYINKLEQVQVMTRHGTRTASKDLQDYFPNNTQHYHCSISTITSRINTKDNAYFIPMEQLYEDNNQLLLHSNCQMEQSWPTLIDQHQQNAQILINAYMNSDDPSQLFDIKSTNTASTTSKYIKFYTSNKERCMISTMVIASHLLNISSLNSSVLRPVIETITNDVEFNPYAPWDNTLCTDNEQYKLWMNISQSDIFDNYIIPKRQMLLEKYQDTMNQYTKQGGAIVNDRYSFHEHPSFRIQNYYCNGMDIPLDNDTFWELIQMGKEYTSIQPIRWSEDKHEQEYEEKYKCIYKFMSLPMYKRFTDNIYAVINGDRDAKKFILHSAHDSSIISFLSGLNLHDGVMPYFAEFFTLEIYSSNIEDGTYLFRFTHKGDFVPYEYCDYSDLEELCDLNILWENGFKDTNITQREWAEESCNVLMDNCLCGYCMDKKGKTRWKLEEMSFVVGLFIGILLMMIVVLAVKCVMKCKESVGYGYQMTADRESDLEIVGGSTSNDL